MSSEQTRRTLNQLDNEIVTLEKNSADLSKKEANARSNAARTMKSIPNNASITTLRSKQFQIDRYNDEAIKSTHDRADNDKKLADKRKKRADTAVKLQSEETAERKKNDNIQKNIQQQYERRISDLTSQLSQRDFLSTPYMNTRLNNIETGQLNEEYDVFISYASEDKKPFVDNLVNEFKKSGIRVWYDDINISWGATLRKKIDSGIAKSKYGIIILSKDYIKKYWTQQELEGLFQRETIDKKVILPIWHNISKDEVNAFSPLLAARKALTSSLLTTKEITNELINLLPDIMQQKINEDTSEVTNDH